METTNMDIKVIKEDGQPVETFQVRITQPSEEVIYTGSVRELREKEKEFDLSIEELQIRKKQFLEYLSAVEEQLQ